MLSRDTSAYSPFFPASAGAVAVPPNTLTVGLPVTVHPCKQSTVPPPPPPLGVLAKPSVVGVPIIQLLFTTSVPKVILPSTSMIRPIPPCPPTPIV